jgi:hypothetical protein
MVTMDKIQLASIQDNVDHETRLANALDNQTMALGYTLATLSRKLLKRQIGINDVRLTVDTFIAEIERAEREYSTWVGMNTMECGKSACSCATCYAAEYCTPDMFKRDNR